MIWIGIIAWFLFIWILDCSINPLFIWITGAIVAFFAFCCIYGWWYENYSKEFKRQSDEWERLMREQAIDEWEKKWGRKHPSRKR